MRRRKRQASPITRVLLVDDHMPAPEIFMNGEFVAAEQGKISIFTHAFAYGTACFEGIRGYWNEQEERMYLFRVRDHYERLAQSCRILHMRLPYSIDYLLEITKELVRHNKHHEDIHVKPIVYKGEEVIGVRLHDLKDHLVISSRSLGNYVDLSGLHCCVSSWRRIDDNMLPARAKVCGAYVNSSLAKSEALQSGFDEAIMLTQEGNVSEGSAENIFLVIRGELVTPAVTENILVGITRDTVMKVAQRELGLITHERAIDRTELYIADEVFLCGTGAQIAPVVSIDRRTIGDGKVGVIGSTLQRLYFDIVRGKNPGYRDQWCIPI